MTDNLLIAHIIDLKTKHEYKIYATGEMTGFPDGCIHVNKFLPMLIRLRAKFGVEALDALLHKPVANGMTNNS